MYCILYHNKNIFKKGKTPWHTTINLDFLLTHLWVSQSPAQVSLFWSYGLGPGLLLVFLSFLGPAATWGIILQRKVGILMGKCSCTNTFQAFAGITSTDLSLIKQVIRPNPKAGEREVPLMPGSHGKVVHEYCYHGKMKMWG